MGKSKLTAEQKRLDADIWIIVITTIAVLGIYSSFQGQIVGIIKNSSINVLLRTLLAAAFQFGLTGLGITIVSVIRKESFASHGLRLKGTLLSAALCVLSFVPYIIYILASGQFEKYQPFQSVWTMKDVLSSGFPINAVGILIITAAWGFFEGFNYVFICDKINKRIGRKSKYFNPGAFISAVMCILIHGAVGVSISEIIEMLTVMIIIYGMLEAKEFTKNAWGCVFIFIFLWNAI